MCREPHVDSRPTVHWVQIDWGEDGEDTYHLMHLRRSSASRRRGIHD